MIWDSFRLRYFLAAWVLTVAAIGCGGTDGTQRIQREGKVTFNGHPVAKGEIIFSPDREKGAKGPGTTVTFENGKYHTRDEMGTLSGPHVVVISGYSGEQGNISATEEPHPWGTVLFVNRRYEINFPTEASTYDFDITE